MSSHESIPEEFSEDFSFLAPSFAPVKTDELPEYTSLAEFHLGPENTSLAVFNPNPHATQGVIETETANAETVADQDFPAGKFEPIDPNKRLKLIRDYVELLVGKDAKLVADELLINDRADHRITHLSIGRLASGEAVVIATDDNPKLVKDVGRETSKLLTTPTDNEGLLTGEKLDKALAKQGENGRGFMISAGLATDGVVHMTPADDHKNLWVKVRDPNGGLNGKGQNSTELAA